MRRDRRASVVSGKGLQGGGGGPAECSHAGEATPDATCPHVGRSRRNDARRLLSADPPLDTLPDPIQRTPLPSRSRHGFRLENDAEARDALHRTLPSSAGDGSRRTLGASLDASRDPLVLHLGHLHGVRHGDRRRRPSRRSPTLRRQLSPHRSTRRTQLPLTRPRRRCSTALNHRGVKSPTGDGRGRGVSSGGVHVADTTSRGGWKPGLDRRGGKGGWMPPGRVRGCDCPRTPDGAPMTDGAPSHVIHAMDRQDGVGGGSHQSIRRGATGESRGGACSGPRLRMVTHCSVVMFHLFSFVS